ncbi:FAD-binding domain-containing protein [Marasmius fiardii PR-910]|nr:FAD-binding domain-containing protein [Marasmius fiardii PR-910]
MCSDTSLLFCWTLGILLLCSPFIAITAQILPPPSSGAVDASLACRVLQWTLTPQIVSLPDDPQYTNGTRSAWNVFNTEYMPACVVFPREASHVQTAMKTVYEFRVRYAVQAGGHSAMKGWNSVQNGILIMFTFMNDVSYDPQRNTITLLPGVRWGEAADALEPLGVAPVGGRVSDVGTGLLLGGGLSFLSPKHGFGADLFIELDVVLVDGRLVTVTVDNEYSDLFKALKGGANRFGIYLDSATEGFLMATANFLRESRDSHAVILACIANIVSQETHTVTTMPFAFLFYNGERLFNATFSQFLALPTLASSLASLSYVNVVHLLAEGPAQLGQGQFFGASAFGRDDSIQRYLEAVQSQRKITEEFRNIINTTIVAFTPVRDEQIRAGRGRGGNAFDPPLDGYNAVQYQVSVNPGASNQELELLNDARMRCLPPTPGLPLYVNECDKEQEVFKTYNQYEFLKRTYLKYDPTR